MAELYGRVFPPEEDAAVLFWLRPKAEFWPKAERAPESGSCVGQGAALQQGADLLAFFADEEQERLKKEEETVTEQVLSNIIQTSLKSPQTIIGKVFDRIGFNAVQDEELRHLVISRICSPMSKKATVDYLRRHFKEDVSLQKIYRYLDKLHSSQQELVQEISVRHTRALFGGDLGLLF